ncbi:kinetochore complex Sim4 subunit Fta1-domain-containing protein [Coniochaeta sp. 2T2.1]|nr:kinetochore complex Sim4 subunit Fta1-domain-containing protein [Coniochaeta sp. 2T2.1]
MPPQDRQGRNSTHEDAGASQEPSEVLSDLLEPGVPFYNTTFSTHRVSPLYVGDGPLGVQQFGTLAKRLRDLLVGDVVRGVEVGLNGDDAVMARAGTLKAVDIGWSSLGSILGIDAETVDNMDGEGGRPLSRDLGSDIGAVPDSTWHDGATSRQVRGICSRQALHISIQYECALCTAVLLPELEEEKNSSRWEGPTGEVGEPDISQDPVPYDPDSDQFHNFPLLLIRMPAPLRSVIIDFLSSTFDCRISPLRLGTQTLLTNLERWITISKSMHNSATSKDVVITLGFLLPASDGDNYEQGLYDLGLKSIDVIISHSDLYRFRREGTKSKHRDAAAGSKRKFAFADHVAKRRRKDGHVLGEGWDWRHKGGRDSATASGTAASYPLTEALGTYFEEHMALNLFDPKTKIVKVACGGFVMSEGRLKLFSITEKDPEVAGEGPVLTPRAKAVVDCLCDLVDRSMVRM